MAYKFTIKGIRKLKVDKVVEKALDLFLGKVDEPRVKTKFREPVGEEEESFYILAEGVSTQGIIIRHMVGGNIIVELPWLA